MKKLLLALAIIIQTSVSQVYVNSITGNDVTGNGSSASPYKTFHKGYTSVTNNGIIDLAGTFTWTDTDETGDAIYTGYTISKHITIRGQGPGNTIIQAHGSPNTADRRVFTISNNYTIKFKNLAIKHGKAFTATINGVYTIFNGGAIGSTSSGASLFLNNVSISTNNAISSAGAAGIYTNGKIVIDKCTFENNSTQNGESALHMYISDSQKQREIKNSTFYNNTTTIGPDGPVLMIDRHGANLMNCTFINNTNGIRAYAIDPVSEKVYISNCIIANSNGWDIWASDGTPNGVIINNSIVEVEKTGTTTISYTSCISGDQTNLNVVTPTTNGGNNNITPYIELTANSVAINAGVASSSGSSLSGGTIYPTSSDQRSALRNETIDIGSFEYGSNNYLSPFPIDYLNSNFEINSSNLTSISTSSDGMWFSVASTLSNANFIIYGNNNTTSISSSDLTTSSCDSRTARIWYLDVTGTVTADVFLDNSIATGISITAATASNYKLLKRESTSGDFSVVASGSTITSTDNIKFSLVSLSDGYYAVGTLNGISSPLPVELKNFTARTQNNNVILNWKTITETNNSGFEVERSLRQTTQATVLRNWEKVAFIRGSGISNVEKNYNYTDNNVRSGKYSYRLKQIDLDGTTEFSQIKEVEVGRTKPKLRTNPNPFNSTTVINFEIEEKTEVTIKLYDLLGRVVTEIINNELKEVGEHEIKFNANHLASGVYLLKFQTNKNSLVEKLVLMK